MSELWDMTERSIVKKVDIPNGHESYTPEPFVKPKPGERRVFVSPDRCVKISVVPSVKTKTISCTISVS